MQPAIAPRQPRIESIDALRGIVMIIMALDHIRDFVHSAALSFSPEDLARTTPVLFFTRWITHFCAPVFMFTAGASVFLALRNAENKSGLSRFLRRRGLWLIVLELIAIRLALAFSLDKGPLVLTVLWALGWSMILLSGLMYLPVRTLAVFSIAVIVLHNLFDPVSAASFGRAAWVWNILHQPGVFMAGALPVIAGYPLIPWFAVMSAGYCFGGVMGMTPEVRRRWMLRLGLGATLAFFVLRAVNVYGNPAPWAPQHSAAMTVAAFFNVTKYPPSLDFLLMTLGPALLLLAVLDRLRFSPSNPLLVFGRVPLFYFLLHLFLAHGIAATLAALRYGSTAFFFNPLPSLGGPRELYPPDYGYSLPVVYLVWAIVVVFLYPVCRWFDRLKRTRKASWLRYL